VFKPTDQCPSFVVNPKIARPALEKQRSDEVEYARLVEDNVPTVSIYTGWDGGMNKVFLRRYPGRALLAQVQPYASYLPPQTEPIAWVANDGSLTSKWFGALIDMDVTGRVGVPIAPRHVLPSWALFEDD